MTDSLKSGGVSSKEYSQVGDAGGGYWSPDLAPTPLSARTWGLRDFVALWVALSACIPTYMLASSLIEQGMAWWQAVATIFLGNLIVLVPMVLNAHAGTRYGIAFPVYWDEYGLAGDAWDTHWNHYPRMVDQLLPGFDKGFSGLILDLGRRGLLDDTLVAVLSDHGRTPKLNNAKGAGRDHWSQVYSLAFAGGSLKKGYIHGASDSTAGSPADRPVSPKDILATMYHLLGIDPHTRLPDRAGQLVPLVPESCSVIAEMIA